MPLPAPELEALRGLKGGGWRSPVQLGAGLDILARLEERGMVNRWAHDVHLYRITDTGRKELRSET